MVEELLAELARLGVVLVANGDRLRYYPRKAVAPELFERLKSCKAEVLEILSDPWPEDEVEPWPEPCPKCGTLELWQTMTGRWRCMKCNPPLKAIKALKRVERTRCRDKLKSPPGMAEYLGIKNTQDIDTAPSIV